MGEERGDTCNFCRFQTQVSKAEVAGRGSLTDCFLSSVWDAAPRQHVPTEGITGTALELTKILEVSSRFCEKPTVKQMG